ncbi:hypothetical protein Tco_0597930 [Tanacetum coccineum]
MYEGILKQLEEFQDNLMGPLRTRLAEIDADFTRCCMRFQESFHPHPLNVVAGRRWLLTHGMKLLVVKCLNSNEYMEALGHAFGRAIDGKGTRRDDFNSAIRELRDLNFPFLQELSNKKDDSTWDIMDLLRLDDAVAETLVEKMERNLIERLPFLKDVFMSIDDPLSAEALIEPPAEVPATNVLSSVVIVPHTDPFVSVEDYDNPDSADVVPENATLVQPVMVYTAAVLGTSFPLRSFNLYDPFPSASVTSYGPSHLGPSFPMSSTQLASLLRYTKSPGLKLESLTLVL